MPVLKRLGERPRLDRGRWPDRPVTRFAPSVTGPLHLGHVVNAAYTWGLARALSGRVVLRLEDHDLGRRRPGHETAILDALDWLGLEPDEGSTSSFRAGPSPLRQSDAGPRYAQALETLADRHRVYACDCSRRNVRESTPAGALELRYAGRCRERGLEDAPGRGVRVELPPSVERFTDGIVGPQAQEPHVQCGDLLLRDRQGQWTYHFAVTVDDHVGGITLVVRGRDLLASTGRQIQLGRMMGRSKPPTFAHHPLVADATGAKLSKSEGAPDVLTLKGQGLSPGEVLALAATVGGLAPRGTRRLGAEDLGDVVRQLLDDGAGSPASHARGGGPSGVA